MTKETLSYRDGTSQKARMHIALQPDYAPIDERTTEDLLAFVARFSEELKFYNENNQSTTEEGNELTWKSFFYPNYDAESHTLYEPGNDDNLEEYLADISAFIDDPNSVSIPLKNNFSRPHFTLLLAFVKLLEHGKTHLNTLTARHLDYYYQSVLKFTKRQAIKDRVHVLVELGKRVDFYALTKGTALNAGKDSEGNILRYYTDEDADISQVKIARLGNTFADKQEISIHQTRENYFVQNGVGIDRQQEAFMEMFKVAFGQPLPGDEFPPLGTTTTDLRIKFNLTAPGKDQVDFELLKQLNTLFEFITKTGNTSGLNLSFAEFHELMKYKWQREPSTYDINYQDNYNLLLQDWKTVYGILSKAATTAGRAALPTLSNNLSVADVSDFYSNFQKAFASALGFDPYASKSFDGLSNITHIDQVYFNRTLASVNGFIENTSSNPLKTSLFMNMDDFESLMQTKIRIDAEWNYINELIVTAAKRKGDNNFIISDSNTSKFSNNINNLLNGNQTNNQLTKLNSSTPLLAKMANVDELYAGLLPLERYFGTQLGDLAYLTSTILKDSLLDEFDWSQIEKILNDAHIEKKSLILFDLWLAQLNNKYDELISSDVSYSHQDKQLKLISEVLSDQTISVEINEAISSLSPYLSETDIVALSTIVNSDSTDKDKTDKTTGENASDGDFSEFIVILSRAAQQKYADASVPYVEEWNNLYFSQGEPDAFIEQNIVQTKLGAQENATRWNSFGRAQGLVTQDTEAPTEIGWMLSAPILNLSQGLRKITLTLYFNEAEFDAEIINSLFTNTQSALRALVSTEGEWLEPDVEFSVSATEEHVTQINGVEKTLTYMTLSLVFSNDIDPIVAPQFDSHGINANFAAVKIQVKQNWEAEGSTDLGLYKTAYRTLKSLILLQADISVNVTGLTELQLQNDLRSLKYHSPFEPFTNNPEIGSRFYFYHHELAGKQLTSMDMNMEWMGLPASLNSHYLNYIGIEQNESNSKDFITMEDSISVAIDIYQENRRASYSDGSTQLTKKALLNKTSSDLTLSSISLDSNDLEKFTAKGEFIGSNTLKNSSHYIQLELSDLDFQHTNYPISLGTASGNLAIAMASDTPPGKADLKNYLVNPPYTPKLKALSLDYEATYTLSAEVEEHNLDKAFMLHVQPFGYSPITAAEGINGSCFLPQYDNAGELYIGLTDVQAPQTLNLLFQMADGSANPDLEVGNISWSILNGGLWQNLDEAKILKDETNGLINSGIVKLSLPAIEPSKLCEADTLACDLYWLRIAIDRNTHSVCDTIALHTQAVSATLADGDYAEDHYLQPLSAEKIVNLDKTQPSVKSVQQPYTSFGGKPAESDEFFYTRVSERLRHKNRALTHWDYEHLILDKFPELYKAKCIHANHANTPFQPGAINIVVIPDIYKHITADPFEPKASVDLLNRIQTFISQKAPASANISVSNAVYIPLKLRLGVRFKSGYSESFYREQLNEDINRFLSPWAFKDKQTMSIGNTIYANDIINLVESKNYIDYVAEIKLFTTDENGTTNYIVPTAEGGYFAAVDRPDGILVAAREHEIDIIPETGYSHSAFTGINYMKIELDFIVS